MANFLSITLKGVEKVAKNLAKEKEQQIQAMFKAQEKVSTLAEKHLKRGLSHNGGRPPQKMRYSPKGSMPYKHFGQLESSIGHKVLRKGDTITSEVGSGARVRPAPYAKYLEGDNHDGIRPFLWAVRDLYTSENVIFYFNKYYKGGK